MIGASWDGTCRRSICAPQPRTWPVTRYATAAPASGTTGAIGDLKIRPTRSAMTTTVTSSSASSAFSMRFALADLRRKRSRHSRPSHRVGVERTPHSARCAVSDIAGTERRRERRERSRQSSPAGRDAESSPGDVDEREREVGLSRRSAVRYANCRRSGSCARSSPGSCRQGPRGSRSTTSAGLSESDEPKRCCSVAW